ncbi:MAG TPA: helix-turn-helix transcriptional regulator [Gammaproteobacteria bacterium]|jgi:hypothetical protein
MTISQTHALSDISDMSKVLSKGDLAYFQAQTRNLLHELVLTEFFRLVDEKGFTKTDLAKRIGRDKAQITRWLRSPTNLQIETVSDLLAGMAGYLDPNFIRIQDLPVRNQQEPDWARFSEINIPNIDNAKQSVILGRSSSTAAST